MIEIRHVDKWYGPTFQALKDCTTSVAKGEVVVVCGPSGSGKSTLIKTVNALETIQQGRIVVDGTAPDGTPEAIYVQGAPGFTLSVQWHPEWNAAGDPVSRPLFSAFGTALRDWVAGRRRATAVPMRA